MAPLPSTLDALDDSMVSAMLGRNLNPIAINSRRIPAVRKIVPGIAGVAFVVTLGIGLTPAIALAAKVDCSKVMSELNSGKKVSDVAGDLKISTSSVYRCRRKAVAAAKSAPATAAKSAPATAVKSTPVAFPSSSH
jgi:hypothetical protein